jgi:hypothetical protein
MSGVRHPIAPFVCVGCSTAFDLGGDGICDGVYEFNNSSTNVERQSITPKHMDILGESQNAHMAHRMESSGVQMIGCVDVSAMTGCCRFNAGE